MTKKHYKIALILFFIFVVVSYFSVRYYQKKQEDRKNKEIINYCEQYKWNHEDVNSYFSCSDYLHLKPKVKKSTTGICHDEKSPYYYKTKNYKVFNSLEDCIDSGGRKPYNK